MAETDGGPAFPVAGGMVSSTGMSLRDWFAGQTISGKSGEFGYGNGPKERAARAYQIADAMLAEREQRS